MSAPALTNPLRFARLRPDRIQRSIGRPVWKSPRRLQSSSTKSQTSGKPQQSPANLADVNQPSQPATVPRSSTPSAAAQVLGIVAYPVRLYNSAQVRRPYLTQFISSLVIYLAGDLSSQYVRRPRNTDDEGKEESFFGAVYDPLRSVRNMIIGGIFSLPSYHWFIYLGTLFNFPSSFILSLSAKVVFNQIAFAPFFNSYFFGMQSLVAGVLPSPSAPVGSATSLFKDPIQAVQDAARRVRDTLPTSWYNSCKFWPLVTAFSFTFVKPQNRSVFAGLMAIGWQTYLGILNQRAVEAEGRQAAQA